MMTTAATALAWLQWLAPAGLLLVAAAWSAAQRRKPLRVPPGPRGLPFVGNLLDLRGRSFIEMVKQLRAQFGDIFLLRFGGRQYVIVTSAALAHEALVEKGHLFASRPQETPTRRVFSADKCTVNSAEYGPLWRDLRRNMVRHMLNAPAARVFAAVRARAIDRLVARLRREADAAAGAVPVPENCRFAVFCILLVMCFGDQDFTDDDVQRVDAVHKEVLLALAPRVDDFLPPVFAPLFSEQRRRVAATRHRQMATVLPLVDRRRRLLRESPSSARSSSSDDREAYVDTLVDLKIEAAGGGSRTLTDGEIVSLCSEFLNGGTDTTATALEWALLHLVADAALQDAVHAEIARAVPGGGGDLREEDLERTPLLRAVVKETLRMHPPTHFLLSHAVAGDGPDAAAKLGGFDVPAGANVEFYTAGMATDERLWPDAAVFRPARFLVDERDPEFKGPGDGAPLRMMPFGAGRRICAGLNVGVLHLTLILGRVLQAFRWAPPPDEPKVDFSEKFAFTVVPNRPLRALITPRF